MVLRAGEDQGAIAAAVFTRNRVLPAFATSAALLRESSDRAADPLCLAPSPNAAGQRALCLAQSNPLTVNYMVELCLRTAVDIARACSFARRCCFVGVLPSPERSKVVLIEPATRRQVHAVWCSAKFGTLYPGIPCRVRLAAARSGSSLASHKKKPSERLGSGILLFSPGRQADRHTAVEAQKTREFCFFPFFLFQFPAFSSSDLARSIVAEPVIVCCLPTQRRLRPALP